MSKKTRRVDPVAKRITAYRERNRIIRAMGFSDYADYLRSDLWASIRKRVLAVSSTCHVCRGVANQVHHRSYRKCDLNGTDTRRLFPICGPCHSRIEFRDSDGEKLNPSQATAKMRLITSVPTPPLPRLLSLADCEDHPIDHTAIRSENGVYLSSHLLTVGDTVRLTNGTVGQITAVRQANYLPQFRVDGQWIGKTRIRTKLVVRLS